MSAGYVCQYIPEQLLLWYLGASVMTFLVYAVDKSKARRGAWRTPEKWLHMLSFIGGWPGAAIAQQGLRHKSKKKAFRVGYWLTVIANLAALLCLIAMTYYP